ncbi:hypothetical protein YTPLAS18_22740 [Nitrospira sp.]|nr:hypothetical protein YTPLAS18_22740 [Nitrospira sp.]
MKPHGVTAETDTLQTQSPRLLVPIDDSDHSKRALKYVGVLLRHVPDAAITLFHVLKPMPRELLEHGGSEDPAVESRLREELQEDQDRWMRSESEAERPILTQSLAVLRQLGFPENRVSLKFGSEDDVAGGILDEAKQGQYDTIVLTKQASSGSTRLFGSGGTTEQILRGAAGYTLWIVD